MVDQQQITSKDFFSNAAARDAGFTEQFWYQAYQLYLDEAARDPDPALDIKYTRPRSIRMPFREGHVDVIVRAQPESREYVIMRFTAFPADSEDGPDAGQSGWWYIHNEQRSPLGEGALLDENGRW